MLFLAYVYIYVGKNRLQIFTEMFFTNTLSLFIIIYTCINERHSRLAYCPSLGSITKKEMKGE